MKIGKFETSGALEGRLQGSIQACVREVDGVEPAEIVRADQVVEASGLIALEGPLAEYVCGSLRVDVVSESIGPGPEQVLASEVIHLAPRPGRNVYPFSLTFPAAALTMGERGQINRLAIVAHYRTPLELPGAAAGFVEGWTLYVY